MVLSLIVEIIYLLMIAALVVFLLSYIFRKDKIVDKLSIAVVAVMFILRLFLIK